MTGLLDKLSALPQLQELLAALHSSAVTCCAAVTGLSPVHRAMFSAALAAETKRPLLLLCADEKDVQRQAADIRVLLDVEREEVVEERRRDYKTLLQEHIQRKAGQELTYCMVREEGPDHAKTFVTEVRLNGAAIGEGSGHSKKESEQMAAKSALEKLDNQ